MLKLLSIIKSGFRYLFCRSDHIEMIYGFKTTEGVLLKNTRISNSTCIECKDKLIIEDNVFISHYNFIDASNKVIIKEGCQIASYISIITHSSHISIRLYGREYRTHKNLIGYVKGPVYIDKYTFIGPHSVIMPNTHIGKGCIVAAYSYVKGEFPDFSIISGNPAKVIGNTKEIDKEYLSRYPELMDFYNQWVQKK